MGAGVINVMRVVAQAFADVTLAGAGQAEQPEWISRQSRAFTKAATSSYSILHAHHNSHCAGHGSHPCCSLPITSLQQRSHYLTTKRHAAGVPWVILYMYERYLTSDGQ